MHHFGMMQDVLYFAPYHQIFHINRLEDYRDKIQFPLPPHRKPVYDFLFVTKGVTRRSKALTPFDVRANTFFFLPAHQITNHEYMTEDVQGYYCHFDIDLFTYWLPQQQLLRQFPFLQFIGTPVVEIDESVQPYLHHLFQRLEAEYQKEKLENFDVIAIYLLALFTEVNRFFMEAEPTKKNTALLITEEYKDTLARYIYEKQLVSEYAELLNVSPNHLNKCVKRAMGVSAQELLNNMIVLEAKVLLKQTDLQIKEIAYQLSKKNHSDFSRFFKSKTGMTPREYKQM